MSMGLYGSYKIPIREARYTLRYTNVENTFKEITAEKANLGDLSGYPGS